MPQLLAGTLHFLPPMTFSMAPLLLVSDDVPAEARSAIRSAFAAAPDRRRPFLEIAARALRLSGVDCADACELVGLST